MGTGTEEVTGIKAVTETEGSAGQVSIGSAGREEFLEEVVVVVLEDLGFGLGLGGCFFLHFFFRTSFQSDSWLDSDPDGISGKEEKKTRLAIQAVLDQACKESYPFLSKPFDLKGNLESEAELGHPSLTYMTKKIKGFTRCIRSGDDKSLFVDDFGVSYRSKHMQAIERQLHLHLNRIEDWADNNGFKFSKSICVHFCRRRGLHPDPYLVLYNKPIPVKKETKFLGILLDSKLTFVPHIKGTEDLFRGGGVEF